MRDKHNIVLRKHKTPFNRERKNHNLKIQKHNIMFGSCIALVSITTIATIMLANLPTNVFADDDSVVSTATITVPSSCSLTAIVDTAHNATLLNGIYSGGNDYYPNGIGQTTLTAFCNDASGFAIYAVGFSGDEYGVTNMLGNNTSATIPTGTATSGPNSQWAMKLAKVTDATAYNPANLAITNNYDSYHNVPNDYEKVASFSSATDQTLGSKLTTTYAAYISATQAADTYTGKVKYTLVHPANASVPEPCENNEPCIRIVVPPNKLVYEDGEEIDPTGMVIKLYNGDGTEIRVINNDEVTFTSDKAEIGKTTDAIYTDGSGINALRDFCAYRYSLRRPWDGNYTMFNGSDPHFMLGDKQAAIVPLGGNGGMGDNDASSMYFTIYNNELFFSVDVSSGIAVWYIKEDSDAQGGWSIKGTATSYERTFKPVGALFGFDSFEGIPVSTRNPNGVNLSTLSLVGDITQEIIVSWQDPDNGRILTTSFDITVVIPD